MKKISSRFLLYAVIGAAIIFIPYRLASNRKSIEEEIASTQRKADNIAVAIDTVRYGTINQNITASGVLEASEVLNVVSETQGKIIRIYREKGDMVTAGDIIAKVDDEVISAAVLTAEANYAQFEKDIDRLTRLSEENAVTKRDLEQAGIGLKKAKADLISARKALSNTNIKAPISGYINTDYITTGQLLGGGSPVCEIVNNKLLRLNIKVTEKEVYRLSKGQDVSVILTAFPGETFTGTVTAVAEKADMAMKFNVEISLANTTDKKLKSGLYAEAVIPVQNEKNLLINKAAIVGSMERPEVFTVAQEHAVKHIIVTGRSVGTQVEVLKGLSENDLLIVSGQLNVEDGDKIRIVSRSPLRGK